MFCFKKCSSDIDMCSVMLQDFVKHVRDMLSEKDTLRIAIATGSTLERFTSLLKGESIPFEKIDLYIVDEYAGMESADERSCTIDLIKLLEKKANEFHCVKVFSHDDYKRDMETYHSELFRYGLDICVLGVGTDGHVGFCYPQADQHKKTFYQLLPMSEERKKEHVSKGWFPSIHEVPDHVITLTLWGMMQASVIMVGAVMDEKREIVEQMRKKNVSALDCPVMYLEKHENITVYLG